MQSQIRTIGVVEQVVERRDDRIVDRRPKRRGRVVKGRVNQDRDTEEQETERYEAGQGQGSKDRVNHQSTIAM